MGKYIQKNDSMRRRIRRIRRSRAKIAELRVPYLSVFRSSQHISAQVFVPGGSTVIVSASSLEPLLRDKKIGNKSKMAEAVGTLIAERAKLKEVGQVAFERSGYRYHGRVRALAEAARLGGLII